MTQCYRRVGRSLRTGWSLLFLLALPALQACTLDRSGKLGCPKEGAISCSVHTASYYFGDAEHEYYFGGQCALIQEKGKSELGDPLIQFTVVGEYMPQTLRFAEMVQVEHDTFPLKDTKTTEWSLEGYSALDPWLYTGAPVGVENVAGNPNEFAKGLCIESIPNEYRRIPFSRNVITYAMTLQQRVAMLQEAASGSEGGKAEAPPPPPPPCPSAWFSSAPEIVMPKPNLAYKSGVDGITVELRSKCGAENVDYSKSIYGLDFEHYQTGSGWGEYRTFELNMASYANGGSHGFDTLPVDGDGLWRVRALQYNTTKNGGYSGYSAWSKWVPFQVGDADLAMNNLENLPGLVQMIQRDNAFRAPSASRLRAHRKIDLLPNLRERTEYQRRVE